MGKLCRAVPGAHPEAQFTAGMFNTLLTCFSLVMGCHQMGELQDELALHLLGSCSMRKDSWELGGVTESFDPHGRSAVS